MGYQSEQGDESESVRLFVVDIIERAKQQVIHDDEEKPENPVYSSSSSTCSVSETAESTASKPQTRISSARSRISLDSALRIRGENWGSWWDGMGWMRRTGLLKSRNEQPMELMSLTSTPV